MRPRHHRLIKAAAAACVGLLAGESFGQWQIDNTTSTFTLTFDSTVAGVNNGAYAGSGFQSSPTAGQLDSDAWAATGWTDGNLAFGGSNTSGDYARGRSNGNVSTGGFYAFSVASGNVAFGIQPGGSDFAPGTLTLKVENNTGASVTGFDLSYLLYVRNDQPRSSSFNFSYSTDGTTFTSVSALNYTSAETADASPAWVSNSRSTSASSLSLSNGAFLYLRWSSADVGGSTSRDEFALDNIGLKFTAAAAGTPSVLYFDTNAAVAGTGGSGSWDNTSSNWSTVSAGDIATTTYNATVPIVFAGNAGVVTVDAAGVNVGAAMSIASSGYQFTGGNITLGGGASIIADAAVTATISSALVGGALNKAGAGTLVLAGTAGYTGPTNVNAGTLSFNGDNRLPSTALNINGADANLNLNGTTQTVGLVTLTNGAISGGGTLAGSGYAVSSGSIQSTLGEAAPGASLTKGTAGTVTLSAAALYTGGTTISGGTLLAGANDVLPGGGAVRLTFGGTLDVGSTSQTVGAVSIATGAFIVGSGTLAGTSYGATGGTISASLAGATSTFTKNTTGTVTLNGAHTYGGATAVQAGTMVVNGSLGNTAVTVDAPATLRTGAGAVSFGGDLAIGGTLSAGGVGSAGTISAGNLTFNAGSVLLFDLGTTADLINLGANALTINGGTINFTGGDITAGTTYTLVSAGSKTGGDFTFGTAPTGLINPVFSFNAGLYTVTFSSAPKGLGSSPRPFVAAGAWDRENFNGLPTTGTALEASTLPTGFSFARVESGQTTYTAGTGNSVGGNIYSIGVASTPAEQATTTERALGSLNSNSEDVLRFGVNYKNESGAPMTEIRVEYTGLQFRNGGSGNVDKLIFEYSTDAASINDTAGTWIAVTALDFTSLVTDATPGAVDPTINQQQIAETIALSSVIGVNDGFWLRWTDLNISGSDDLLAIDNLSVIPEPTSLGLLGLATAGLLARRRRAKA